MDEFDDIEEAGDIPEDSALRTVARLAEEQLALEQEIAQQEATLAETKEKLRQVQENALPTAMLAAGLSNFALTSGHKIAVITDHFASIAKENHEEAMRWFHENGFGDLVKEDITISFGRGETEMARGLMEYLAATYGPKRKVVDKTGVHYQTLGAFIREQLGKGAQLPEELLGVHHRTWSKITAPKSAF